MSFLEKTPLVGWYIAGVSTVAAISGILQIVGLHW